MSMDSITSSQQGGLLEGSVFTAPFRRISGFRVKVPVFVDVDHFTVKSADTDDEVNEALRLRYEVFYRELMGKKNFFGIDLDRFDQISDHLILIDRTTDSVVGTYRLNSSQHSRKFYSSHEFNISNVLKQPGVKLELGRACVSRNYRSANMIGILWMGLLQYIQTIGARYLFGCSSVNTADFMRIAIIHRYLREFHYSSEETRVHPVGKYRIRDLAGYLRQISRSRDFGDWQAEKGMIPSLLNSYLQAGAKICGEPAFDRSFQCADFFTLLDFSSLNQNYVNGRMDHKA